MKPLITIVAILLMGISAAHLVRIIFQVEMTVGGFIIPIWVSIIGFIIPLVLALLLDRENKKELIKTQLSPMKIIKK
jgi:membrane associated rhomboid family serine protease